MNKQNFGPRAWNTQQLAPKSFRCGYCGQYVSSDRGFATQDISPTALIYACHHCGRPTFFDQDDTPTPGPLIGGDVAHIHDSSVRQLYDEARKSGAAGAYTSSVLTSRKLLMNIAVSLGAEPGKSFIYYVEFLSDNHYVPPGAKSWVDHIREKGNEATHEIVNMDLPTARDLINFIEMLLKIIFEFPGNMRLKSREEVPKSPPVPGMGTDPRPKKLI